ncbi:MAG TPA: bifunctional UDP-sugar hydrolase/5'-nucleotidase [Kofleriaceae bacterium]|nr:bifunctional UDP-sugar hydrolase/5'-nucleotidase [Kofleriaceae bacterium]
MRGFVIAVICATSASACTVQRDQPNLVGQDVHLTLIHTADIHSRLFPYTFVPNTFDQGYGLLPVNGPFGGIAKIATVAHRIRATAARSLWLDSGDCFEGAPVFNKYKGEAEVRALSMAGLDAEVIGNHEFDLGAVNLFYQMNNWAQFPLLAANYHFVDPPMPGQKSLKDIVAPYEIFDAGGVKVGVIGMGNTSSLTSIYEQGNSLGFVPIDSNEALQEQVRQIRGSVDVVVVLSHLGLDADENLSPSQVPDENQSLPLAGVDVILGGHLHIVTNPPKVLQSDTHGNQTVLVHSGAFAKYVGRLDLTIHIGTDNNDPDKRSKITGYTYTNIPIDSKIPDDPDVANLLWPYSVALARDIDLNGVFAYTNPTGGANINRADNTGGDSQLGNLVARAMQVQTGIEAQFALTNSLGIRDNFYPGPLTIEQMFNVFPFENSITVMYLSGTEVQELMDFNARKSADRGCKTQSQVAGIYSDMVCKGTCPQTDPNFPAPTACAKNIYIGENCRGDDPNGPIIPGKCAPLVPSALYRVAVNDYIANGGSGYTVLKRNSSKQFTTISLRDSLTVYLHSQPPCADNVVDTTDKQTPQRTVKARWGAIPCLDEKIEAHDGRIRPVFE